MLCINRYLKILGEREVSVLTTGHDKVRLIVFLTGRMDGRKLKPFILMTRKRPIPEIERKFSKDLKLSWSGKEWMTDELTSEYLTKVIGDFSFSKRLLIWDSYRCHISDQTSSKMKSMNIEAGVIPGGTTKFIQPGDVVWNSIFKSKIKQYYED